MPETFLILLAAGIMLAAAISDPRQVTLQWLRLCGILALSMAALSLFFFTRRTAPLVHRAFTLSLYSATVAAILAQLALAQTARRTAQRISAALAAIAGIAAAISLLYPVTPSLPRSVILPSLLLFTSGIAAMTGLCLMDMLLGHAYLTASRMGIAPFLRLNLWLAGAIGFRFASAAMIAPSLHARHPTYLFWGKYGLYIFTRWLVGLVVPAVFAYMAHDCIRRRSTQSATGILYVAGVLVFIGELLALYLVTETGLPF